MNLFSFIYIQVNEYLFFSLLLGIVTLGVRCTFDTQVVLKLLLLNYYNLFKKSYLVPFIVIFIIHYFLFLFCLSEINNFIILKVLDRVKRGYMSFDSGRYVYEAGSNINSRKTTFNSPKLSKKKNKSKSSVDMLNEENVPDKVGGKGPVILLDQKRRVRRVRAGQPEEINTVGEMLVISMEQTSSKYCNPSPFYDLR